MIENAVAELLPSSLELLGAERLCRQLQEKLASAQPILLDGSKVDRISTPCIQVLVAVSKSADARGVPFTLNTPSKALVEALADLGLDRLLTGRDS